MSNKSESDKQSTEYDPHKNSLFVSVDGKTYTCKELIHIVHGYYKAVEVLRFYAEEKHILTVLCRDFSKYDNADWVEGDVETGQKAREALKEIG